MSKVTSDLPCPGCKFKTKITFKKPDVFTPVILTFDCSTCGSTVTTKIRKLPKSPPGQINMVTLNLLPSAKLIELMKEEAEHNAKPLDESP